MSILSNAIKAMAGPGGKDPKHVIIRRKRIAAEVRTALYGKKVPLPGGREHTWALFVKDFWSSGLFYVGELLALASELHLAAHEGGASFPDTFDPDLDLELLQALEGYLRQKVREEGRDKQRITAERAYFFTMRAQAKQALLDGECPWCGTKLPCTNHEIGCVELDGNGGLVQTGA